MLLPCHGSSGGGASRTWLVYLAGLHDVRELSAALLRHCSSDGLAALVGPARTCCGETELDGAAARGEVDVTADMVQIAMLTLKELCEPQCALALPATELGLQALQAVERQVLPRAAAAGVAAAAAGAAAGCGGVATSCSGRFMEDLYPSTVDKVLRARSLCLRALLASVSSANCFTLLSLARHCGISPLHERALACCLADVGAAIAADPDGFASLEQGELVAVLAHDGLQVGAESDVVDALNCWVAQRPDKRRPQYAQLLERCVRLGAMSLKELEGLDQHPQAAFTVVLHVARCPCVLGPGAQTQECMDVTRLVAHVYVYRIMGLTSPRCEAAGQQPRAMPRPQAQPQPQVQAQPELLASLLAAAPMAVAAH